MSEERLSVLQYAKTIPINEKVVRRAIEDGKIAEGYDRVKKKIIVAVADDEWGDMKRIEVEMKSGVSRNETTKATGATTGKAPKIDLHDKYFDERGFVDDDGGTVKKKNGKKELPDDFLPDLLGDAGKRRQKFPELDDFSIKELLPLMRLDPSDKQPEASRKREIVALAMDKLKLQELERTVIPRDEVNRQLAQMGTELKLRLQAIPVRVVRDLMACDNEVEGINILTKAINDALEAVSNMEIAE